MMNYDEARTAVSNMANGEDSPIRMWPVDQEDVREAEERIGRDLPQSLKEVWFDIGAGFFQGSPQGKVQISRINALMSPDEVADACEGKESGETTPFFDVSDGDHLVLTTSGSVEHPVYPGVEISPSLKAFIAAVTETPDFWNRQLPSPRP